MARPPKLRRVEYKPEYTYFKPAGVPKRELEEIILHVEEIEAIRLRDVEDLEQEACAQRMHISRPTFQRVLSSARKKIATSLLEGKALRIEGGHYRLARRHFRCRKCAADLKIGYGRYREIACPRCGGKLEKI
ncbi:MAG TPA: DUF134 domain-containing protein [Clostridia bacterium]|jgi:predicted DNA-binding protein (UPF0251 family)|nr:DUF134 domain-containing protein [Clostridia bacterium]